MALSRKINLILPAAQSELFLIMRPGRFNWRTRMMKSPSAKLIIFAFFVLIAVTATARAQDASPTMTLLVDESQAARRIAFVHEEIRVQPGPLALFYPRWIPGEHGPTGPIQQMAALRIHTKDATLPWKRDPEEIYTIHVEVPSAVQ